MEITSFLDFENNFPPMQLFQFEPWAGEGMESGMVFLDCKIHICKAIWGQEQQPAEGEKNWFWKEAE